MRKKLKGSQSIHLDVWAFIALLGILVSCAPPKLNRAASSSSTTTSASTSSVNIEVPIELLDVGIQDSFTGAVIKWEISKTSLNTNDYDGSPQYFFEVIADNSADIDFTDDTVSLINAADTVVASITIPAASTTRRLRSAAFTPTSGANSYRVQTSGIAGASYKIYAARIIIQQTAATKTKIYIPLAAGAYSAASTSTTTVVFQHSMGAYTASAPFLPRWKKETANLANLASSNPWTFEAVIMASGGCTTYATLYNVSAGPIAQVTASEINTAAATPTLVSASFSDSATNFTNNADFEVQTKLVGGICAANGAKLHKAGLWVKLENGISKAQSFYRVGRAHSYVATSAGITFENQRALISTTLFSNPTVYYEISGYEGAADSATTGSSLNTHGTNDNGIVGAAAIGSSDIQTGTTTKSRIRSGALSITSGDRFIVYDECDDMTSCYWNHNLVIVNSSSN